MTASLYIHIPFCRHKCIYCDFYSSIRLNFIDDFLTALDHEIDIWSEHSFVRTHQFSTLYIGGGTPSLLSPGQIETIFTKLFVAFDFVEDAEISLEANPGTILTDNLSGYRTAGINRLTLGVQSFHDSELHFLTRIHSAADALTAFETARHAGFQNIGIDLIFAVPGQTIASWQHTLEKALTLKPNHISMYGLTYEENTPLRQRLTRGLISACDETVERDMFLLGMNTLRQAGYQQYEISNFAMPGCESKHNQKYWDGSPFLSLGPSAHSFDGRRRWWNVGRLERYVECLQRRELPIAGEEELSPAERLEELVLLGLRRQSGLSLSVLEQQSGEPASELLTKIQRRIGDIDSIDGFAPSPKNLLLTLKQNHLSLTQQGLLLYNNMSEKISLIVNKEFRVF